jgi:hypothetical protein
MNIFKSGISGSAWILLQNILITLPKQLDISENSSKCRGELPTAGRRTRFGLHNLKVIEKVHLVFCSAFQNLRLAVAAPAASGIKFREFVKGRFSKTGMSCRRRRLGPKCKVDSRRQLTPNFGRIFGPRAWATL